MREIISHNLLENGTFLLLLPLIISFCLIAIFTLIETVDKKTSVYFFLILFSISTYMQIDSLEYLEENIVYIRVIQNILFSIGNILFLSFYFKFSLFRKSDFIIKTKRNAIILIIMMCILSMIVARIESSLMYLLSLSNLLITLITCIYAFWKERYFFNIRMLREQKIILSGFCFSFFPFILFYGLFARVLPNYLLNTSLYFMVFFPISIMYTLIKRNQISFNFREILLHSSLAILAISISLLLINLVLQGNILTIIDLCIILLVTSYSYYEIGAYIKRCNQRKIQSLHDEFQLERDNLYRELSYTEFNEIAKNMLNEVILNRFYCNDFLLFRYKDSQYSILGNAGTLKNISMNTKQFHEMTSELPTYFFNQKEFFKLYLDNDADYSVAFIYNRGTGKLSDNEAKSLLSIIQLNLTVSDLGSTMYDLSTLNDLHKMKNQSRHYTKTTTEILYSDVTNYIHDDILQNIFALKKIAEVIQTEDNQYKNLLIEGFSDLASVLREKIFFLYPSTLLDIPIEDNLSQLCRKLSKTHLHFPIEFDCPQNIYIENQLKFILFRSIQEVLTNACRHANASRIQLSIKQTYFHIIATIYDNGIGFDKSQLKEIEFSENHHGLLSVVRDIETAKGNLMISSDEKIGTTIKIQIPHSVSEVRS
ncbi:sensor histidine kinase [Candidatus Enterococcus testudinis]|uniref:sensor histidine kinase n=1 Tax=Candidatus Enterococcus testudinis TaxID=1834191 RepID=UPI001178CD82|nr:ATP-binding protein [Enterococcus sp. 8G7_MSG3316]